jgi:predicted nuclease with TOPRIM domain
MAGEKERFEMLLEEIRDNVKQAAEGHSLLNDKVDRLDDKVETVRQELKQEMRLIHSSLKNEINVTSYALKDDIKEVEKKLDLHMQQPVHA